MKDLIQFFSDVVAKLEQKKIRYALAGGLIASVYRETERMTGDLDFLMFAKTGYQRQAETLIKSFGLHPTVIRKADLEGGPLFAIKSNRTEVMMVCGRDKSKKNPIGLDFILPSMPWFESALQRAELNRIDFGLSQKIPSLTVEDVIVSKLFALKNRPQRFSDLDDLQSIFAAKHDLDLPYILDVMMKLELMIPKELKGEAPKVLGQVKP